MLCNPLGSKISTKIRSNLLSTSKIFRFLNEKRFCFPRLPFAQDCHEMWSKEHRRLSRRGWSENQIQAHFKEREIIEYQRYNQSYGSTIDFSPSVFIVSSFQICKWKVQIPEIWTPKGKFSFPIRSFCSFYDTFSPKQQESLSSYSQSFELVGSRSSNANLLWSCSFSKQPQFSQQKYFSHSFVCSNKLELSQKSVTSALFLLFKYLEFRMSDSNVSILLSKRKRRRATWIILCDAPALAKTEVREREKYRQPAHEK